MKTRNELTASELISRLQKLPGDTVVTISDWDSEWGRNYL